MLKRVPVRGIAGDSGLFSVDILAHGRPADRCFVGAVSGPRLGPPPSRPGDRSYERPCFMLPTGCFSALAPPPPSRPGDRAYERPCFMLPTGCFSALAPPLPSGTNPAPPRAHSNQHNAGLQDLPKPGSNT